MNIKQARSMIGDGKTTQTELGEMVGVSKQTIVSWEKDTDKVPFGKAKEIAALAGITVNELD